MIGQDLFFPDINTEEGRKLKKLLDKRRITVTEAKRQYFPTPMKNGWRSEGHVEKLVGLIDAGELSVREAEEMAGGSVVPERMQHSRRRKDLQEASNKRRKSYGINPEWLESLMGWPTGWSDLKPLAMDRFRKWLHLHF